MSPAESPAKSTDIDVLSVTDIQNAEERRDAKKREEHQEKQNREDQETKTDVQITDSKGKKNNTKTHLPS